MYRCVYYYGLSGYCRATVETAGFSSIVSHFLVTRLNQVLVLALGAAAGFVAEVIDDSSFFET